MTTLMIIGIVLLYSGIFIGVWRWSYLLLEKIWDDDWAFVGSFFIGVFWPVSGIACIVKRILDRLIKKV